MQLYLRAPGSGSKCIQQPRSFQVLQKSKSILMKYIWGVKLRCGLALGSTVPLSPTQSLFQGDLGVQEGQVDP